MTDGPSLPAEVIADAMIQQASNGRDFDLAQMVEDVLVTAIESGMYGSFIYAGPAGEDGVPRSMQLGAVLNAGGQIEVTVKDENETHELDRDTFVRGCVGMAIHHGWTLGTFWDQHDVVDADGAVQLAVFGRIEFS